MKFRRSLTKILKVPTLGQPTLLSDEIVNFNVHLATKRLVENLLNYVQVLSVLLRRYLSSVLPYYIHTRAFFLFLRHKWRLSRSRLFLAFITCQLSHYRLLCVVFLDHMIRGVLHNVTPRPGLWRQFPYRSRWSEMVLSSETDRAAFPALLPDRHFVVSNCRGTAADGRHAV